MSVDVYQEVTNRIIAALESGTVPWRRPWIATSDTHRNPVSKTEYRGINPFLLEMTAMERGYSDPRWVTFKQARKLGGCVRTGEKSTLIIYWKILTKKDEETGKDKSIPLLRYYRVFNVEQCENLDKLPALPEPTPFNSIERAEQIIENMPNRPTMGYGGNAAFYHTVMDHVQLPKREHFNSPELFYSTAFHELGHSTGHDSRLARPEIMRASAKVENAYDREELTAELTASMLSAVCGIQTDDGLAQSAAYIDHWLKAFRDDPKMLISAGAKAHKAADYIRGIVKKESENTDEQTHELAVAA